MIRTGTQPRSDGGIIQMAKLMLVWNRDHPRYALTVKGFSITRSTELECLKEAIGALERCLQDTRNRLEESQPQSERKAELEASRQRSWAGRSETKWHPEMGFVCPWCCADFSEIGGASDK